MLPDGLVSHHGDRAEKQRMPPTSSPIGHHCYRLMRRICLLTAAVISISSRHRSRRMQLKKRNFGLEGRIERDPSRKQDRRAVVNSDGSLQSVIHTCFARICRIRSACTCAASGSSALLPSAPEAWAKFTHPKLCSTLGNLVRVASILRTSGSDRYSTTSTRYLIVAGCILVIGAHLLRGGWLIALHSLCLLCSRSMSLRFVCVPLVRLVEAS